MTFREWVGWQGWADFIAAWVQLNIGFLLVCFGMTLMVKAHLGMGSWSVFQLGLCNQLGISFGVSLQLVGALLLIVSYLIGRIVASAGTFANMLLIGIYVDYIFDPHLPDFEGFWVQLAVCLGGIVLFGIGSALYLSADLGPGPRDSIMMALYVRTRRSLRRIRTIIELSVLFLGWLLGGPVGIGTVLFSVLIGPIIQFVLEVLPYLPIRLDRGQILLEREQI
ncbi:MAG: YitT family protein [Patescibacteria group bacterium]|nr:YitT family protein [Patescibacteria group bacterium]